MRLTRARHGASVLITTLLASAWSSAAWGQEAATPQGGSCVECHGALDDERLGGPVRAFVEDTHGERGLTCTSCHGGDDSRQGFDAMDPRLGFVGRPSRRQTPQFCGRCHSDAEYMRQYSPSIRVDQVTEYVTSVHGQRLQRADTLVATCTSCHPAHHIRPPSDPLSTVNPNNVPQTCGQCHADSAYMAPYGIPTDQLARYHRSIHWEMISVEHDLAAPTCNDCHGNHGAAPPGVSSVGNVCGQCHAVMADNFRESRHSETFAMMGMPGCATCHGNHEIVRASDAMVGMREGAVCMRCHTMAPEDVGGQTAIRMRELLDSLDAAFEAADSILLRAEQAGMEVSQALFELGSANNAAVSARAAMHAFDLELMTASIDTGLAITAAAHARADQAMEDLRFRRTGLALSVAIIAVMIVGLLLKIRELKLRNR